jgi:RNA ligase
MNQTYGAIPELQEFVRIMASAGVRSTKDYRAWSKDNESKMNEFFGYGRSDGMPGIYSLVNCAFHPQHPLALLNYTQLAHNTLHGFPAGWTRALRLCRGIVIDLEGKLVALPFAKFFNFGEQAETANLPAEPFEATVKYDGHLGIIFSYADQLLLTTRGYFDSPTSVLGSQMLAEQAEKNGWNASEFKNRTLLAEIIHPQTKVYVNYGQTGFIAIGATQLAPPQDFNCTELQAWSAVLNLPVTETWNGDSLAELAQLMKDRGITNQEGYVVRFQSGLRVKFKFENYIGLMVADKLTFTYLMNRLISGNAKKMLATLPEEIFQTALQMLGKIMLALATPGVAKDKWKQLYLLVPEEERTSYFQGVCRQLAKTFTSTSN